MSEYTYSETVQIDASPEAVYDLVSDVTRTGEWSPICQGCDWEDGDGPEPGAHFVGRNEHNGREWQTRSEVVAATRPREFSWLVGEGYVYWGYRIDPADGGTRLTESWEFRPEGRAMFAQRYGDDAQDQIEQRTRAAHEGIPATLAALKRIAESAG